MAFTSNRAPGTNNQQSNDDNWKAAGFLNVYLPMPDGTRKKVGAIPLKASKPFEKAIHDRLIGGGDEAFKAFINRIEFDYNSAEAAPVAPSELGF